MVEPRELDISLEPHIIDALRPVQPALPTDIKSLVQPFLVHPTPTKIPYNVLLRVSQWIRTPSGQESLQLIGRHPSEYSMISLLAGSKTSPDKIFPPYTPPKDPHLLSLKQKGERRAITAVINGFVSIIGTGLGVWWASGQTGYRDEWRVLLAFAAAMVVAFSEIVLFIIWQSKSSGSGTHRISAPEKKKDQAEPADASPDAGISNAIEDRAVELRERITSHSRD